MGLIRHLQSTKTRALLALTAAVFLGAPAGGCDWTEFDKLSDDVPVRAFGAPEGLDGFSPAAIALRRGVSGDPGYRQNTIVIGGFGSEAIVVVKVKNNGTVSRRSGGGIFDDELNEPREVSSVVQIESTGDPPVPTVLVGSAEAGKILALRIPDSGHFVDAGGASGPNTWSGFGGAVTAGEMGEVAGSGPGIEEWIAASDDTIFILYGEPKLQHQWLTCPVPCTGAFCASEHRSAVVGKFFTDLDPGTVAVALGAPNENGGQIHLFRWRDGPPNPDCGNDGRGIWRIRLSAPASPAPVPEMFGASLLAVDLNNDQLTDLIVGAPDVNRVYVYMNDSYDATGWQNALPSAIIEPGVADDAVGFGGSLALVEVDGQAPRELVVGDPEGFVGSKRAAGRAHIFSLTVAGTSVTAAELATVSELQPNSSGALGIALTKVVLGETPWNTGAPEELVVVGRQETFVFFLTGVSGDRDPR